MPDTMVNSQGSHPSSTTALLNAVRMPKLPHPGHHAGFCPFNSAKVTIDLLQQSLEGERPAVVLVYGALELEPGLHAHQRCEPAAGVVLDAYGHPGLLQHAHKLLPSGLRERVQLAEVHPVSYTHLRAHETDSYLVCRLL